MVSQNTVDDDAKTELGGGATNIEKGQEIYAAKKVDNADRRHIRRTEGLAESEIYPNQGPGFNPQNSTQTLGGGSIVQPPALGRNATRKRVDQSNDTSVVGELQIDRRRT